MGHHFEGHHRFRRSPSTSYSRIADQILVLDLETRRSHRLTETAAFIWDALMQGSDLYRTRQALVSHFQVDEEEAWTDLCSCVETMLERGFLVADA